MPWIYHSRLIESSVKYQGIVLEEAIFSFEFDPKTLVKGQWFEYERLLPVPADIDPLMVNRTPKIDGKFLYLEIRHAHAGVEMLQLWECDGGITCGMALHGEEKASEIQ